MKRTLLEGEAIIFQEQTLTITNLRVWIGSRSSRGLDLRTVPLKDISEISLTFRRPLRAFLLSLAWAAVFLIIAALLPAKILFFPVSMVKFWVLVAAGVTFLGGLLILLAGSSLALELRGRGSAPGEFSVTVQGINADPEKFEAVVLEVERLLCGRAERAFIAERVPPLPRVA